MKTSMSYPSVHGCVYPHRERSRKKEKGGRDKGRKERRDGGRKEEQKERLIYLLTTHDSST